MIYRKWKVGYLSCCVKRKLWVSRWIMILTCEVSLWSVLWFWKKRVSEWMLSIFGAILFSEVDFVWHNNCTLQHSNVVQELCQCHWKAHLVNIKWIPVRRWIMSLWAVLVSHFWAWWWFHVQSPLIPSSDNLAVQSCPPSMMYAVQSGIRATTTVVWFMHYSFRTHFKGAGWSMAIGCKLPLRAGIAGIWCHVSMLLEWQLNIVCAAVPGCSHLLLIAGGHLLPQILQVQCSVGLAP